MLKMTEGCQLAIGDKELTELQISFDCKYAEFSCQKISSR